MIAIGDGFMGANGVVKDAVGTLGWVSGTDDYLGSTQRAYARHLGKANMVFCDGHTESPQLPTLFGNDTQTLFRRWNRDHQPTH